MSSQQKQDTRKKRANCLRRSVGGPQVAKSSSCSSASSSLTLVVDRLESSSEPELGGSQLRLPRVRDIGYSDPIRSDPIRSDRTSLFLEFWLLAGIWASTDSALEISLQATVLRDFYLCTLMMHGSFANKNRATFYPFVQLPYQYK